jgi:hypothetical protein
MLKQHTTYISPNIVQIQKFSKYAKMTFIILYNEKSIVRILFLKVKKYNNKNVKFRGQTGRNDKRLNF